MKNDEKNPHSFVSLWSMILSLTAQQAHFSKEYKELNRGKAAVLVPEVHELANILAAISRSGRKIKIW